MKKLLILAALLFSVTCNANSNEVIAGSLTYHVFNFNHVADNYSNKMNPEGTLIDNLLVGYRRVQESSSSDYTAQTYFAGENSIAEPMAGIALSRGVYSKFGRIGGVVGFYLQDNRKMLDRGIMPVTMFPCRCVAPAPIVGVEAVKTIELSDKTYFMINSLISPILINATVGIGWKI